MARVKDDNDSNVLALLGKKQVLKRRFGFWSLFGFAVCELITWETVLALFSQGFNNGGPAGLVYGFIIAWSSTLSVYTVISELASMAPIAAGQYYWVYMLAPPRYKVFCSYIIGWLTSLAWVATVATETIFAGTMLQGLIILDHENDYNPTRWQGTLLAWLVIAVGIFINVVIPGFLPKMELGVIVFHISGFIAIMTVLWVFADHNSAHFVFTTALNEGGWSTQGLSYCVGFLGNVATFVGADASVHMAEEVERPAVNIPRAIISSMLINGMVGFAMMLTILFCIGDVDAVLESATGYPFIQIFYESVDSVAGATAMGAVVLMLTWACSIGIITTASRMTWAFARDGGIPFSSVIKYVSKNRKVPTVAILVVTGIAALLTLIYIGSYTAFNDVISLTITGFYSSYLIPASFLLYHRVKGHIMPHKQDTPGLPLNGDNVDHDDGNALRTSEDHGIAHSNLPSEKISSPGDGDFKAATSSDTDPTGNHLSASQLRRRHVSVAQVPLVWGPFHVPGWFGTLNNAYACVYMVFVIFWSVWPPATPVTYQTMNYSVVVTGGVIIFSIIWYYIRGRKEYSGPLVDDEVAVLMGRGSIVNI